MERTIVILLSRNFYNGDLGYQVRGPRSHPHLGHYVWVRESFDFFLGDWVSVMCSCGSTWIGPMDVDTEDEAELTYWGDDSLAPVYFDAEAIDAAAIDGSVSENELLIIDFPTFYGMWESQLKKS